MIPELHKILYGDVDHLPRTVGRRVTSECETPQKITTGDVANRIKQCLAILGPATICDISESIEASIGVTASFLKLLVKSGEIESIRWHGNVTEYTLCLTRPVILGQAET